MANEKIDFNEVRARQWKQDVKNEVKDTQALLKEIYPVLQQYDEEDTLMATMKESGKLMEENFTYLCTGFNEVIQIVDGALEKLAQGVVVAWEKLKELLSKIR